jgi:hypothetical protein
MAKFYFHIQMQKDSVGTMTGVEIRSSEGSATLRLVAAVSALLAIYYDSRDERPSSTGEAVLAIEVAKSR